MPTILLVDDDTDLLVAIEECLELEGYDVITAVEGQEALEQFYQAKPDLLVTDIRMPGMDGWELCRRVREASDIPILVLTAHATEPEEVVRGFDLGADDYVRKPFELSEFSARVRALLRRPASRLAAKGRDVYVDSHLLVDLNVRRVLVGGKEVALTSTEFDLLALLVRNRGRVVTTQIILQEVWGLEHIDDASYPRVYISRLREKLEPDPGAPIYFLTEYGVGYRFSGPV
jgi:two-component system KDP operon response regulator KdpE